MVLCMLVRVCAGGGSRFCKEGGNARSGRVAAGGDGSWVWGLGTARSLTAAAPIARTMLCIVSRVLSGRVLVVCVLLLACRLAGARQQQRDRRQGQPGAQGGAGHGVMAATKRATECGQARRACSGPVPNPSRSPQPGAKTIIRLLRLCLCLRAAIAALASQEHRLSAN